MGNMLYLECATGISADMVVGALLDLGANEDGLRRALASLEVDGFELRVTRKQAGAIAACDFDVVLDEAHDGHDHDMEYLYGHLDADGHGHHHAPDGAHGPEGRHHGHGHGLTHEEMHALGIAHHHTHGHEQGDGHHEGGHGGADGHPHRHGEGPAGVVAHAHDHDHLRHHEHRTPADIASIVDAADLAPRAKAYAHRIFDVVTTAEAQAHGVPTEQVLFHEVGAVDSIVDVVAAAYCLDDLDVDQGVVSALAEGHGRVRTAHGVLPVPVPAVANIVAAEGLVLAHTHREGEFVTPTGAAIAAAIRTRDVLPERYRIRRVGYGSGKRAYDPPSTVRAMIVEEAGEATATAEAPETSHAASRYSSFTPHLWKLETEMDDVTGEALGNALERLYAAGACEAHYVPVFMKKNRPGYQVEVLCDERDVPALEEVLFEETTTIGIRRYPLDRTALHREPIEVATTFGRASGKRVTLPDGRTRTYPEFASVAALAEGAGIAYQDAWQAVVAALPKELPVDSL